MKPLSVPVACALLACLWSGSAFAAGPCYTVYGKDNAIVYRSEEPPIDLSRPIHVGMAKRFPNGHLVMQAGAQECLPLLPEGTLGATSGVGGDDSPALKLRTPSSSAQAEAEGQLPVARRTPRARRAGMTRPAAQTADASQTTAPAPVAAIAPTFEEVAYGSPSLQRPTFDLAAHPRGDGRVVASYTRSGAEPVSKPR